LFYCLKRLTISLHNNSKSTYILEYLKTIFSMCEWSLCSKWTFSWICLFLLLMVFAFFAFLCFFETFVQTPLSTNIDDVDKKIHYYCHNRYSNEEYLIPEISMVFTGTWDDRTSYQGSNGKTYKKRRKIKKKHRKRDINYLVIMFEILLNYLHFEYNWWYQKLFQQL